MVSDEQCSLHETNLCLLANAKVLPLTGVGAGERDSEPC